MSRSSAAIAVESADLIEQRWDEAGRRLREVEPDEFYRILALARAFVSLHDPALSSREDFNAMVAAIRAPKHERNN